MATADLYQMRQLLVGSPGLLSRSNQKLAEKEHQERVFFKHGLGFADFQLLPYQWCVRYVNARRHVERELDRLFWDAKHSLGLEMYRPGNMSLPPVS